MFPVHKCKVPQEAKVIIFTHPKEPSQPPDFWPIHIPGSNNYGTIEHLTYLTAQRMGITPATVHLFGLVNLDLKTWPGLRETVEVPEDSEEPVQLVFRLRYRMPVDNIKSEVFKSDKRAFQYIFYQIQDDFVNGRIEELYNQTSELSLGLAVTCVICKVASMENSSLDSIKDSGMCYIPTAIKQKYKALSRFKMKMSFDNKLKEEMEKLQKSRWNLWNFRVWFLKGLLKAAPNYLSESFETVNDSELCVSYEMVTLKEKKKESLICQIKDILTCNLVGQGETREILITTKSTSEPPTFHKFRNHDIAVRFIYCLDGYLKLVDDFYSTLWKSVPKKAPESYLTLKDFRCHGPISNRAAETKLIKKGAGSYLIQQDPTTFDRYLFKVCSSDGRSIRIDTYHIEYVAMKYRLKTGTGSEEPYFENLEKLIEHYRSVPPSPTELTDRINPPRGQHDDVEECLLLCRQEKFRLLEEDEEEDDVPVYEGVSCFPAACLRDKTYLCSGHFTNVSKATFITANEERQVAVKELKPEFRRESFILECYQRGIDQVMFMQDARLQQIFGICLAPVFCVIEEYAPLGCLSNYLQNPVRDIKVYHLIWASYLLVNALMALREKNIYHGNIRCRNVLVMEHADDNGIVVKLADPGMVNLYCSLPSTQQLYQERLPWLAPEVQTTVCNITPTNSADVYAFGTTLWEIFSLGTTPLELPPLEEPQMCNDETFQTKVYSVMTQCWSHIDLRPEPRDLMRDIWHEIAAAYHPPDAKTDGSYSGGRLLEAEYEYPLAFSTSGNVIVKQADRSDSHMSSRSAHPPDTMMDPARQVAQWLHNLDPSMTSGNESYGGFSGDSLQSLIPKTPPGKAIQGLVNPAMTPSPMKKGKTEDMNGHIDKRQDKKKTDGPVKIPRLNNRQLIISDEELGRGFYGAVKMGVLEGNNDVSEQKVAVKTLLPRKSRDTELKKEFEVMKKLDHPHIVKQLGMVVIDKHIALVMEYVAFGSLEKYLKKSARKIDSRRRMRWCYEVAQGMTYLSGQNIIHRDLATRNVLVDDNLTTKISDFGLARILDPNRDYYKSQNSKIPAFWTSPEGLEFSRFTTEGDIWSYGVTVWEIFTGQHPNILVPEPRDPNKVPEILRRGDRLDIPHDLPEPVKKIMKDCWQYKAKDRPSFQTIVAILMSIIQD